MRAQRAERGFTLVEIMVVIVILGGLVAIVGPNVIGNLKKSDRERARIQMQQFATAIQTYYIQHRKVPANLEDLAEADPATGEAAIERIPLDPWGRPYGLRLLEAGRYRIWSLGEDGVEGSEDDLVWPEPVI